MKTFVVTIKGVTPLLHHKMPEEQLFALLGAKSEKKKSQEELTPREIADKHAYKGADGTYCIPLEYISGAFAHVASDYKQKNTARKSLKTVAKGVFRPLGEFSPLFDEEGNKLKAFEVDIRKATNHQKGAVAACRPRFDRWMTKFQVSVDDSIVAPALCLEMLNDAGKRAGLGSYRVARGGYFGQFQVVNWEEIE